MTTLLPTSVKSHMGWFKNSKIVFCLGLLHKVILIGGLLIGGTLVMYIMRVCIVVDMMICLLQSCVDLLLLQVTVCVRPPLCLCMSRPLWKEGNILL